MFSIFEILRLLAIVTTQLVVTADEKEHGS